MAATSFHRIRVITAAAAISVVLVGTFVYGTDYYRLELKDRVVSQKHSELRPGGSLGVKLGAVGAFLFCCLYAYPIRKRWKFLQRFGKTKNWLDFHVLFGVSAPLVITLHSSFKLQGIAGIAYWLMMAVMASGFVGRYFYAQIPRRMDAVALTLDEVRDLSSATRNEITKQKIFSDEDLRPVLAASELERTQHMSLLGALCAMVWMDARRPFRVAVLRRHAAESFKEKLLMVGGLLPSSNRQLEEAVRLVRRQSWLLAKISFLGRTNQIFKLWHVVHRPFSHSFAVLAVIHITLVLLLGYF
jgi:hypothetical protein